MSPLVPDLARARMDDIQRRTRRAHLTPDPTPARSSRRSRRYVRGKSAR